MVDATYIDQNRIQIIENDDISFDTRRPSIALFPDANRIVHSNFNIYFPNLFMNRAYYRFLSNFGETTCSLYATLPWQEWGPFEGNHDEMYYSQAPQNSIPGPTTRNLPQTYLGSVPPGTNYLDIRVRLTRNDPPANFIVGEPPICMFPQGQWIHLPGGSCTCEFHEPLLRHFDIVLEGNNVWLRRYQSVNNADVPNNVNYGGGNSDINNNMSGWSNSQGGGSYIPEGYFLSTQWNPKSKYWPATLIDYKPFDTNGNKRPNGTNPCSGPFPDLASNYIGDIIITPGIYKQAA